jgi:general secretion pathway protein I
MKTIRRRPDSQGFTLVEVLVALLILALALVALQLRMTRYLEDAAYLRDKTLAMWVASNQLELLHLAQRLDLPNYLEQQAGVVEMMDRPWFWHLQTMDLPLQLGLENSPVSLVYLQVSPTGAEAARIAPLVSLTGVSGRNDAP